MSEPPAGPQSPSIRASDAERQRIVEELREHSLAGRLTLEEFSTRIEQAYAARTRDELDTLTSDLPATAPATAVARRQPTRWSVAVMGGVERRGRWRLSRQTKAVAFMGGVQLDLRQAEIDAPEVAITAIALMGGIEIIVPEGVEVEVGGFVIMGGKEARVSESHRVPGAPIVRVRAFGAMGGVSVKSKPLRRRQ